MMTKYIAPFAFSRNEFIKMKRAAAAAAPFNDRNGQFVVAFWLNVIQYSNVSIPHIYIYELRNNTKEREKLLFI